MQDAHKAANQTISVMSKPKSLMSIPKDPTQIKKTVKKNRQATTKIQLITNAQENLQRPTY